jgi:ABC-type antimicrobial peptide transport system permease subunit
VGLLKYIENEWGYDEHEWNVYVDYRILTEIIKEVEKVDRTKASESRVGKYDYIRIKVTDMHTAELIQQRLFEEEGIVMNSYLAEYRDGLKETQRTTQMLLGGIGAISLFVAAIGIANTMFMSIYERTKEIGVMKVLGCPLHGIQSMFLFEASIIGFCGGLFGSALSVAASTAMNRIESIRTALSNMGGTGNMYYSPQVEQGDMSVIPLWLIVVAIIFSTVVGLVSGYFPARRATKISALEAIRNE